MTLTEYLASPQAIEDVRALLNDDSEELYTERLTNDGFCWGAENDGAWVRVDFMIKDAVSCYYRQTETGYIVSDCGEAVSGIMRRTGRTSYLDCEELANAALESLHGVVACPQIMVGATAADLPAALVSVLSAVAKCAEVG